MQAAYRLFRRENGVFYAEDIATRRQSSLGTKNRAEAKQLVAAKNQAAAQPSLNKEMAKTYLKAVDPQFVTRTWEELAAHSPNTCTGPSSV